MFSHNCMPLITVIVVILPEGKSSASENFEIIKALQNQVDPELFSRPGVYDGRRNLFTAFKLPFEGAREVNLPGSKVVVPFDRPSIS
jgi:hypothetical protein